MRSLTFRTSSIAFIRSSVRYFPLRKIGSEMPKLPDRLSDFESAFLERRFRWIPTADGAGVDWFVMSNHRWRPFYGPKNPHSLAAIIEPMGDRNGNVYERLMLEYQEAFRSRPSDFNIVAKRRQNEVSAFPFPKWLTRALHSSLSYDTNLIAKDNEVRQKIRNKMRIIK